MSITNRNNKCRTCLKSGSKLLSISIKPKMIKGDKTYMELLNHIAQVEFNTDDEHKMPQSICSVCSKKIRDSYTFIEQVRKSNTTFLKSVTNIVDENSLDKLEEEESIATDNVLLDECDIKIKEEVNPFDDEEMNASSEEHLIELMEPAILMENVNTATMGTLLPSSTTSSNAPDDDVNFKVEVNEHKEEQAELFPECVLNEKLLSDDNDDSLSDNDSTKTEEDDPTYNPLVCEPRKRPTKEISDEDKNLPIACDDCDKVFPNFNLLKRHKRNTHVPDELKVQCPHCPAKFGRLPNMYTHIRTLHKIEPIIEQKSNPKKEHNSIKCEHCQKSYCNKYRLMEHIKRKHGPDESNQPKKEKIKQLVKRFLCALCGFTCHSQPNLNIHYRRHTGERPFKCEYCDRRFFRLHDAQMHALSHTGERPYKCTECEKGFRSSGKLTIHMRTHTNERPYACTECEKTFKQSKDLTIHRRIHTGERPYKCDICESTFTQSNSLRLHQKKTKHSNVTPKSINDSLNSNIDLNDIRYGYLND
ncbi:zinc finger protein 675-like [Musca vetustissima]|uniref:zinc finger protein 675-like n=1 Tax=Musca vetustissima TaxID=27455 RepID=UPI002AB603BB|nr:zinc finger protein 675-like [Musca vetustissima]